MSEIDRSDPPVDPITEYQGFPSRLRLRKSTEFSLLFKHPDQRLHGQGVVVLAKKNSHAYPRLGLAISKKHLSSAVARNFVKRVVRESFRRSQHRLRGWDVVVISRSDLSAKADKLGLNLEDIWQRLAACGN